MARFEQEQWDAAIAEFQEAIQLDPELGLAYGFLGYSYALGSGDLEKAIEALEEYLPMVPEANDRAQVASDIQQMREALGQVPSGFEIPPGKALCVFTNYTNRDWDIDVGPYHLDLPAWQAGQAYPVDTVVLDPGTYTWHAHSPDGGDNVAFAFTVAAGEIYPVSVR